MNSPVSAMPMIAASTDASIAASPSVAPTVRCSITSTGTGRAPPLIRIARSSALCWVNCPVIWVADPAPEQSSGWTAGEEITSLSSRIAIRCPPAAFPQARRTSSRHSGPPWPLKATETTHVPTPSWGSSARGVLHPVAVQDQRAHQDRLPVLVLHRRGAGGRGGAGLRRPADHVEPELGGPADHPGRLPGVLHAGQLDDDPTLAGAGQRGLGDAQGVDAAAEHLERAVGGLAVGLDPGAVLGLQDDLGAALEVEAEPGRQGQCGEQGQPDDDEGRDGAPERGAGAGRGR